MDINIRQKITESMKKIDFKDRRYALPAIAFPFVIFFAYQIYALAGGNGDGKDTRVVTTDINDELPQIGEGEENLSRAEIMKRSWQMGDGLSAVDNVEKEEEDKLDSESSYSEKEKQRLDSIEKEKKAREEMIRRTRQQLSYGGYSAPSSPHPTYTPSAQQNGASVAAENYAREIRRIQQQIRTGYEEDEREEERRSREKMMDSQDRMELERLRQKEKEQEETHVVKVVEDDNGRFFHSVQDKAPDDKLIKAMIDQTLKVQDGTRIRLKLLNDVTIDSTRLEKGTYLYATVKGFSGQRVLASISSILVGDTFIKVSLSLFDNDGMEGFYVPASSFREMVKNAGANAVNGGNMNMTNNTGSTMSGEYIALQAIQQAYSGVTQAVSSNIRRNKAKIKYNTVVYLINTSSN